MATRIFPRLLPVLLPSASLLPAMAASDAPKSSNFLWYKQPGIVQRASVPWASGETDSGNLPGKGSRSPWECQSLPVGNGRIGGTLFGGDHRERINLNEVSLWTGGSNLPHNGEDYEYGPKAGKDKFGCYQPFGNIYVDFDLPKGAVKNYVRSLDLSSAIARTRFSVGGVEYDRECFVSHPDDVLVYRARASKPASLSAKVGLTPCHDVTYSVSGKDTIVMSGTLANGEAFEGRIRAVATGGKLSIGGNPRSLAVTYKGAKDGMYPSFNAEGVPYFDVQKADSLVLYVALATDYKMDAASQWKGEAPDARNKRTLSALKGKTVEAVRKAHVADHRALFKRLSINLGRTDAKTASLPTDARLVAYRKNPVDPELEATIYQYGRYMLIAGSRPGNLPLNLQGIWNEHVHAAWACDYHNNINLQMCYWGAEVANLSECHTNLIDFIRAMQEPLSSMTKKHFGEHTKGWTTRISQNPWGGSGWKHWNPPVNAWYALHIWDHYLFTQDRKYLADVAYPLMKNICAFWESHLKELGAEGEGLTSGAPMPKLGPFPVPRLGADGHLVYPGSRPLLASEHPELKDIKKGALVSPNGWSHEWGPIEDGCMHDQQLVWELFDNTVLAAKLLDKDAEWASQLADKRDRLVPNRIASGGYLQEWIVDRPNMVSGHRHTSHLVGVFPGSSISLVKTPDLARAAAKSLELRGLSGDNRRSWTWPWRTALWARLGRAETAHEMVQDYIKFNLLDNLFGNHPPMQLDGTYGITGGMSEILVQSHAGRIELLPALPAAWKNGSVSGIRARGGITIDMSWKDGKVTRYALTTSQRNPKPVKVLVNGQEKTVTPVVTPVKAPASSM